MNSCQKGSRSSQDRLYREFYAYAMGVCLRYSKTKEEATEIVNDGFVKIFTKLDKHTKSLSFKSWLRRVMINSAIDYYRRNEKHYNSLDISHAQYESSSETALDQLSEEEIIKAIQELPPSYRMVFNLYVIEGFKHDEIANKMNISIGTSKSNLSVARNKLQKHLMKENAESLNRGQNG